MKLIIGATLSLGFLALAHALQCYQCTHMERSDSRNLPNDGPNNLLCKTGKDLTDDYLVTCPEETTVAGGMWGCVQNELRKAGCAATQGAFILPNPKETSQSTPMESANAPEYKTCMCMTDKCNNENTVSEGGGGGGSGGSDSGAATIMSSSVFALTSLLHIVYLKFQ